MFKEIPIGPEADEYWEAGLLWVWSQWRDKWTLDTSVHHSYKPTVYQRNVKYAVLLED